MWYMMPTTRPERASDLMLRSTGFVLMAEEDTRKGWPQRPHSQLRFSVLEAAEDGPSGDVLVWELRCWGRVLGSEL